MEYFTGETENGLFVMKAENEAELRTMYGSSDFVKFREIAEDDYNKIIKNLNEDLRQVPTLEWTTIF